MCEVKGNKKREKNEHLKNIHATNTTIMITPIDQFPLLTKYDTLEH